MRRTLRVSPCTRPALSPALKRIPLKWNQRERQRRSAPSPRAPGLPGSRLKSCARAGPTCVGEGLGRGVVVMAQAASTNCYPHPQPLPTRARCHFHFIKIFLYLQQLKLLSCASARPQGRHKAALSACPGATKSRRACAPAPRWPLTRANRIRSQQQRQRDWKLYWEERKSRGHRGRSTAGRKSHVGYKKARVYCAARRCGRRLAGRGAPSMIRLRTPGASQDFSRRRLLTTPAQFKRHRGSATILALASHSSAA